MQKGRAMAWVQGASLVQDRLVPFPPSLASAPRNCQSRPNMTINTKCAGMEAVSMATCHKNVR